MVSELIFTAEEVSRYQALFEEALADPKTYLLGSSEDEMEDEDYIFLLDESLN